MKQVFLLTCIFLLPNTLFAQAPFHISHNLDVFNQTEIKKLIKQRGYHAVSAFDTISYKPLLIFAIYVKKNKLGILDNKGKEICPAIYEEIVGLNRDYNTMIGGIHKNFTVKKDRKYGLISSEGKVLIPTIYDYVEYKDSAYNPLLSSEDIDQRDSVYFATIGKETTIYNRLGKKLGIMKSEIDYNAEVSLVEVSDMDSPFDMIPSHEDSVLPSGNIRIKQRVGNQWMYGVKKENKILIPAEYEFISEDRNHRYIARKNKKYGLLDSLNRLKMDFNYDYLSEFNDVYLIGIKEKLAVFSTVLKPLTDYEFDLQYYGNHQLLILSNGGKYGILNYKGQTLTPFIYDKIELITNCYNYEETPLIRVTQGKYQGLLNHEGQELTNVEYDQILPECTVETEGFSLGTPMNMYANSINQFYFFQKNRLYGIMDTNFHITTEAVYDEMIKSMMDTIVYVAKYNDQHKLFWGLLHVNSRMEITKQEFDIAPKYQRGGYFTHHTYHSGGFFRVRRNGMYGLVNEQGSEIIPMNEQKEFYSTLIYNGLLKIETFSPPRIYYIDYLGNCTKE